MEKYKLSDYQWKLIEPLIPPKTSTCGRARRDPRELMNGIVWVLRTGSPWCALPEEYGSRHTIYNNFRKWSQEGIMENIFKKFTTNTEGTTEIQIDSTYVKAHQHSAGCKKGGLKMRELENQGGGLIHAVTNENGLPMKFMITGGNVHDCKQTESLLSSVIHRGVKVLADKAYDADKIIKYITNEAGVAVIPTRNNRIIKREYDKEVYKNRNQIERFFNRLKQFRRIATRYDKLSTSFLSLIQLAATLIIIPKFPPIV